MKNFIEVTKNEAVGTKRAYININNISYIERTEHTCRIIYVGNSDENYLNVLQSYDEVKELIDKAQI